MFKFKTFGLLLLLVFALFLSACSRTVIAREVPPTSGPEPANTSNALDAALKALETGGASVEEVGEVTQPFFSVSGAVIKVNGGEVQLFLYEDPESAKAEAGLVSPSGTAVGTNMMMWMATPHFYHHDSLIALYVGDDESILAALEAVFGPPIAGGQTTASSDEIGQAALTGLETIGWDITGFTSEVAVVEGDYARVNITTSNPPGGFTVFMIRQDGAWTVAYHGSAYDPEEIKEMGFPDSVLK